MNLDEFWQFVEGTHTESSGLPERQFDLLVQALVKRSVSDIIAYDRIFETLMNRAYTTDVWNAAYIITSCSDDGFTDFRGWLIAQGKTVFENALREPDTLADIVSVETRDQCRWQSLSYVAYTAYEQKTHTEDIPGAGFHPVLTGILPLLNPGDACQTYYPKLWAKFGWLWRSSEENDQPE